METVALKLEVTLKYALNGAQTSELENRLRELVDHAMREGLFTGSSDAEVEEVRTSVQMVSAGEETSMPVKHWDAYCVDGTVDTHQFDVADQRRQTGQMYLTLGAIEGGLDDLISVTMEVNTNPLNGIDHVPCCHVHFDGDSVAMSLFKIGDKILVRPETGVTITSTFQKVNGFGEELFWVE